MQACERHNTPPHAEKGDIARPSGDLSEGEYLLPRILAAKGAEARALWPLQRPHSHQGRPGHARHLENGLRGP